MTKPHTKLPIGGARLPNPTPSSLEFKLQQDYATRFHMFLIVATSIAIALLITRGLLELGFTEMWVRYALALVFAYITFFFGVWVWLHLSEYGRHLLAGWGRRRDWNGDTGVDVLGNINVSPSSATPEVPVGGGGSFDGGGASGSWDVPDGSLSVGSTDSGLLDGAGDAAGALGGADEGGCLLVIAGALLAVVLLVVFGATAYVVYQAPAILAEVVFEVLLGSPLARGARALDSADWSTVLFRKTWKAFALMAAAAMAFALFCNFAFPQATSAGEVLKLILR